ncbi:MAG: hypothetical protein J4N29_06140 [Chloroflexi bacterium]|nr:hypothetical protein [Chloroflexota bacterium]MCI0779491.1 hypothetical protein [Chloroflexota bacterium]MCI0816607.1 hypothetical protein [Chloroflexota bacterium]MCI0888547.1 hypothetical protein [Chloroflexota bacterium]
MKRGRTRERGYMLVIVLIVLAIGSTSIVPVMNLVQTGLTSNQIQTKALNVQYSGDAGSEFAIWQLHYGDATSVLTADGEEVVHTVSLNGTETIVVIRLNGASSQLSPGPGAEDNRTRPYATVECARDGDGVYDDDCLNLPGSTAGMLARYTVYLEQISPDTGVGVTAVYNELPSGFDWSPALNPVDSLDGSFPEIESASPVNIGSSQNQVWKWDLSSPIFFTQGQVRQFTFVAEIDGPNGLSCNRVFLKMEDDPNESSGPTAFVRVGTGNFGCANGGTLATKYVDRLLALPNQTTVFTYIINVENLERNVQHIQEIEDVLPPGFLYCNGPTQGDPGQTCDPPLFKITDDPFDPVTGSYSSLAGYAVLPEPSVSDEDGRVEIEWEGPGAGWFLTKAGGPKDTLIIRFQAEFTPNESGSYYNELFVDVSCSAPSNLIAEGVTTQEEYCASYSWPTSGVLVPSYDIRSITGGITGQGNAIIAAEDGAQLTSWHIY